MAEYRGRGLVSLRGSHAGSTATARQMLPYIYAGDAREDEVQAFLAAIRARLGPVCGRCGYRQNTAGHRNICGDAA